MPITDVMMQKFVVGLVLLTSVAACKSAQPTAATVSAPTKPAWKALPASLLTSAACPAADWQCVSTLAKETGGTVLGPKKHTQQQVLGVWVDPKLGTGETQRRIHFYLPRGGGRAPVSVEQWDTTEPELALFETALPTKVNGASALFSASRRGGSAGVVWQVGRRSIDVSIRQDPAQGAPTEQELLDIASSLVPYRGSSVG